MIPLKDENPTQTFPFITILIILINIFVFIYELSLGDRLPDEIKRFAVTPYNLIHMASPAVLLTLVTALFFHGGFTHILGNMLYLWVFGNNIEDRLGHLRFIFFYLACGILATLGHVVTDSNSQLPLIGASGAIFRGIGRIPNFISSGKDISFNPFILSVADSKNSGHLVFRLLDNPAISK